MLVSLNWLKELVDIDVDPVAFGDIMTMAGTKVETITPVSDIVSGIFTGKIVKIENHPNADRLRVCTVDFGPGKGERVIITNAKNVFEGAVVPVALEGAVIGDGTKMGSTDFRGVTSYGMMCSVAEMGMDTGLFSKEVLEGIYIMPEGIEPGLDIRHLMWVDDRIIDFEITANRADCQSIYGIAKEAAAALNQTVAGLDVYDNSEESSSEIEDLLTIKVESPLCSRYMAKMFKVKKVEPSPLWMQLKLINSGVRPINNIVDVTNYVMLELGQPLHAFDYQSLGSKEIVVKTTDDKKVITLDEQERDIDDSMLMITNGSKPVAIAGIMGGLNSEITSETEYVVLESACFDKTSIRLTSKKLGLRTEASGRYEKGLYPNLVEIASERATYLLQEIGACEIIPGVQDVYPNPTEDVTVDVNCDWINRFLGLALPVEEMETILHRLFLETERLLDSDIRVFVPDYRQDLRIPEDIAEEVARIYGYDQLPSTIMGGTTLVGERTPSQKYALRIKNLLAGQGYYETLTTSFTCVKRYEETGFDPEADLVNLRNPLGEDSRTMRNNLTGHQLELIALNNNRNNPAGRFFEIAKTYHAPAKADELPVEVKHLVLSAYGDDVDFFDFKGDIEMLFEASRISGLSFEASSLPLYHPGRQAKISVGEQEIGVIGEIHPQFVNQLSLPKRTYVCELNFDLMTVLQNDRIRFTELPKFPGTARDIAMVVDVNIPAAKIESLIREQNNGLIQQVELFDVYQGKQIPDGKKSLAYSIFFRHMERTLTEDDVKPVMDNILNALKETFNAELRD